MILTDFDETLTSTFNPDEVESIVEGMPKIAITCFSYKLFDRLVEYFNGEEISKLSNGNGKYPIYKIKYNNNEYALFMSVVGAAACTVQYEEAFAKGIETIITFGTCGCLDAAIKDLAIIIPSAAIRDEGTSYHYLKASDEVEVNKYYKEVFIDLLKEKEISYIEGKAWTTDAPYRETRAKVAKRKEQGCVCVDMECSALGALAQFRNKKIVQFFYAADNLDSTKWDKRSLGNSDLLSEKEKIGLIAVELADRINKVSN